MKRFAISSYNLALRLVWALLAGGSFYLSSRTFLRIFDASNSTSADMYGTGTVLAIFLGLFCAFMASDTYPLFCKKYPSEEKQ